MLDKKDYFLLLHAFKKYKETSNMSEEQYGKISFYIAGEIIG